MLNVSRVIMHFLSFVLCFCLVLAVSEKGCCQEGVSVEEVVYHAELQGRKCVAQLKPMDDPTMEYMGTEMEMNGYQFPIYCAREQAKNLTPIVLEAGEPKPQYEMTEEQPSDYVTKEDNEKSRDSDDKITPKLSDSAIKTEL